MSLCANCGIATDRCNTIGRRRLEDEIILSVVQEWVAPQTVTDNDFICQSCWNHANAISLDRNRAEESEQTPRIGHRRVCIHCGRSLLRRVRCHQLGTGTVQERRIYEVITEWILPRVVRPSSVVCHSCWVRASKASQRFCSSPSLSGASSPAVNEPDSQVIPHLEEPLTRQSKQLESSEVKASVPEIKGATVPRSKGVFTAKCTVEQHSEATPSSSAITTGVCDNNPRITLHPVDLQIAATDELKKSTPKKTASRPQGAVSLPPRRVNTPRSCTYVTRTERLKEPGVGVKTGQKKNTDNVEKKNAQQDKKKSNPVNKDKKTLACKKDANLEDKFLREFLRSVLRQLKSLSKRRALLAQTRIQNILRQYCLEEMKERKQKDNPVIAPSNDIPSQDMSSNDMPSHDMTSRNISPQNMPSHDIPSQNMPSNDIPSHDMTSHNISPQNMPSNNMPYCDMTSNNAPTHDIVSIPTITISETDTEKWHITTTVENCILVKNSNIGICINNVIDNSMIQNSPLSKPVTPHEIAKTQEQTPDCEDISLENNEIDTQEQMSDAEDMDVENSERATQEQVSDGEDMALENLEETLVEYPVLLPQNKSVYGTPYRESEDIKDPLLLPHASPILQNDTVCQEQSAASATKMYTDKTKELTVLKPVTYLLNQKSSFDEAEPQCSNPDMCTEVKEEINDTYCEFYNDD